MKEQKNWQSYIDTFLAKNAQINLSAIRDAGGVYTKHVCDAIELQNVEKNLKKNMDIQLFHEGDTVIDIGTGGGVPLLPLAIVYPQVSFTGLDSVRKKTEAVKEMAQQLQLSNVEVIRSRAEEHKKQYDCMTARAVAFSDILFKWTYPLVKKGGYFILYKMFSEEEESRLDSYVFQKKMNYISKHYYKLFDDDIQRVIYILQK